MAGNLNKVFLMGNLTRDVELRHTTSNQAVANIGIAVNRRWRTPEGEQREEVTFIDCEAWGKTAETMSRYLSKGRPVFIEGRLKLDQWEKEGQKFSKLRVVIDGFQFIDSRSGAGPDGGGGSSGGEFDQSDAPAQPYRPASRGPSSSPGRPAAKPAPLPPEDDVPF